MTPLCIDVGSQKLTLFAERAAYWHEASTLLVADLHLGRQEAWRVGGVPISALALEASLNEPLARLSALMAATCATRLLVLGDLLHAPAGVTESMVGRVAAWRRGLGHVRFEIVPGNHDRELERVSEAWSLDVHELLLTEAPFLFVHDPAHRPGDSMAHGLIACCGHVHPMVRLSARGDSVRVPSFIVSPERLLLPAFSGMGSGATVRPGPFDRVYAISGSSVIPIGAQLGAAAT